MRKKYLFSLSLLLLFCLGCIGLPAVLNAEPVTDGRISCSEEKLAAATQAGAAGMICYNNVPKEEISMAIENFTIPAVSVTFETGELLILGAAGGNVGKLTVSDEHVVIDNIDANKMSDFTFGLCPQFRACGQVMGLTVISIIKLIQYDAFAICLHF